MITDELRESLAEYINANYEERLLYINDYTLDEKMVKDSGVVISKKQSFTLDQLMEYIQFQ